MGEEQINISKPRRRSNSHSSGNMKSKFEVNETTAEPVGQVVEEEPVEEEVVEEVEGKSS